MPPTGRRSYRLDEPIFWRVFQKRGAPQILLLLEREGRLRFGELDRTLEAISRQILATRLVELREVGMVNRDVEVGPPLSTWYSLTPAGRHLAKAASVLEEVSRREDLPALVA